jgi:thiamine transport system permease protein
MAGRLRALGAGLAGPAGLVLVLLVVLLPVAALLARAGGLPAPGPADRAALRFTAAQALVSAALSVALAVPLARALARRRFAGRAAVIALMGAPFLLPAIVAVLGIVAVWGRSGLAGLDIYGAGGVVLAHVFFNLPLVARLLLQGWAAVPPEHLRLAAQLGAGPRAMFRLIEAPILRAVLPGAFLAVFALCLTSFAIALSLGGGPAATTLEVAIYQALRFDFDLGRAALLALAQLGLCALAAALALRFGRVPVPGAALLPDGVVPAPGGWRRLADAGVIGLAALFLGAPLAMVVLHGLAGLADLPAPVVAATLRSLGVALASATVALALGLVLALWLDRLRAAGRHRLARSFEAAGHLPLAASPLVLGTGLFLLLRPVADPVALALPVTVLVNAAMALPFALRLLLPALEAARLALGPLADSLAMGGRTRFRLVTWPALRRPAGLAAGLAAALAMGDLGVIALFARPDQPTLPLLMHGLMGSYRMEAAAGVALVLLALSLGLFWLLDRRGLDRRGLDRRGLNLWGRHGRAV